MSSARTLETLEAELAAYGFINERGAAFSATSIASMLRARIEEFRVITLSSQPPEGLNSGRLDLPFVSAVTLTAL
jgi:hypothetical protein